MARGERKEKKFETALDELERVVEMLESGELSLEESLAAFEQGIKLVKHCSQKLGEIERKIELLTKDREGKLTLEPLDRTSRDESADEES
jgi:exodeoxyribonuclease VII small subunit